LDLNQRSPGYEPDELPLLHPAINIYKGKKSKVNYNLKTQSV